MAFVIFAEDGSQLSRLCASHRGETHAKERRHGKERRRLDRLGRTAFGSERAQALLLHVLRVGLRGGATESFEVERDELEQLGATAVHLRAGLAHLAGELEVMKRAGGPTKGERENGVAIR